MSNRLDGLATGNDEEAKGAASPRMTGEDRRQQIVTIAMRVFSERGFRGTTTREIARAAGVSEAIIFRHFATKEELYSAILDHKACAGDMGEIRRNLAEAIAQGDDRAVFEGYARAMLEHHETDIEFMRLLLHSALEAHELFKMFWDRNVREMADFLCGYIRERQKAGSIRQMEPLIASRAFTGMIVNHSMVNNLFDRTRSLLDVSNESAAREFTEILLRGIGTSSGDSSAASLKPAAQRRRAPRVTATASRRKQKKQ